MRASQNAQSAPAKNATRYCHTVWLSRAAATSMRV